MANNQKKYVGLNNLQDFLGSLKTLFATKSDVNEELAKKADVSHPHSVNDLTDYVVDTELSSTSTNPVANSTIDAEFEAVSTAMNALDKSIDDLSGTVSINRNESIIGLSIDGRTITYIKGDGTSHTFETQDTNTEYFLATDEVTGLTKLYKTVGNAEDGTMTQKAIKEELDKKVGVSVDDSQGALIFTI